MKALNHMEEETIAEVGNISLGAAASALSAILNRRVFITTPHLEVRAVNQVEESYAVPCLLAEVRYLSGLQGNNVLMIKQEDAAIIAGLMIGEMSEQQSLGEMELSAIQEAMNQMMGYMATAMSEMFGQVVEISPPKLTLCELGDEKLVNFDDHTPVVELAFSIQVEGIIDSKLIQVIPIDFAKKMTGFLLSGGEVPLEESPPETIIPGEDAALTQAVVPEELPGFEQPLEQAVVPEELPGFEQPLTQAVVPEELPGYEQPFEQAVVPEELPGYEHPFEQAVLPEELPGYEQPFEQAVVPEELPGYEHPPAFTGAEIAPGDPDQNSWRKLDLVREIPLEVTVILGRTRVPLGELFALDQGSVLALTQIAGSPVEIQINKKPVARGEVVLVDDQFGVRITEHLAGF